MHHLVFANNPFSCGEPSLVPLNNNSKAQGPYFNLNLDTVQQRTLTSGYKYETFILIEIPKVIKLLFSYSKLPLLTYRADIEAWGQ